MLNLPHLNEKNTGVKYRDLILKKETVLYLPY